MGLRVILDMNLVTGSPLGAAEWTRAARATLPHRSLVGLEIGNEPDIYDRTFWIGGRWPWGRRGGPLPARPDRAPPTGATSTLRAACCGRSRRACR